MRKINTEEWKESKCVRLTEHGEFSAEISGLKKGAKYQYRKVVKHPLIKLHGNISQFISKK